MIWTFYQRHAANKVKIAFLALVIYAALC